MSLGTETVFYDQLASDPGTPENGQHWYNSTSLVFKYYDGTTIQTFSTAADLAAHIAATNPHTVTLEQARTAGNTLAGDVDMGGNALLNVATAAVTTSAPNLQQVRDEIEQAIQGDAWHDPVISALNTPPGAPALGDRYLIDTAPTGAWAANADYITEWDGSAWQFFGPPVAGWTSYDQSTPGYIRYNGTAWTPFGTAVDHGSLLGLLDDDHTQYLLVSGTRAMAGALDMGSNNVTNGGTFNGVTVEGHAARHVAGGADQIDGDTLHIDYSPTNYTPSTTPPEVTALTELTAHLAGLDAAVAGASGKAGLALNADFTGTPLEASVTFNTAQASAAYVVRIGVTSTGRGYTPRIRNKTTGGFTIRLGSNNKTPLVSVDWAVSDPANP
jgi:hypothetical protein